MNNKNSIPLILLARFDRIKSRNVLLEKRNLTNPDDCTSSNMRNDFRFIHYIGSMIGESQIAYFQRKAVESSASLEHIESATESLRSLASGSTAHIDPPIPAHKLIESYVFNYNSSDHGFTPITSLAAIYTLERSKVLANMFFADKAIYILARESAAYSLSGLCSCLEYLLRFSRDFDSHCSKSSPISAALGASVVGLSIARIANQHSYAGFAGILAAWQAWSGGTPMSPGRLIHDQMADWIRLFDEEAKAFSSSGLPHGYEMIRAALKHDAIHRDEQKPYR